MGILTVILPNIFGTQSLRDNADYDAIDTISKKIAQERIKQAEKFIAEAERLL